MSARYYRYLHIFPEARFTFPYHDTGNLKSHFLQTSVLPIPFNVSIVCTVFPMMRCCKLIKQAHQGDQQAVYENVLDKSI